MGMKHSAARRYICALVTSFACSGSLAVADTVELDPAAFGSAWDDGPAQYEMPDGQYEGMQPDPLWVWKMTPESGYFREYRTRYEFALPPELQQLGVTITRATLSIPIVQGSYINTPNAIFLSILPADDTLTLQDFAEWYPVASVMVDSGLADFHHRFEVADILLAMAGGSHQRVGFNGAISGWSAPITWTADAKLTIEYSPPSPTLPGLSLLEPLQDEQHLDGTPIRLYALASDAQDGHINAAIQWQISTDGDIFWQGSDNDHIMILPVGDYQVTAAVTDSDGNTVTHTRHVAILPIPDTNQLPVLSIVAPVAGLDLLEGISIPLQATATDAEDGDVSANIVWTLDGQLLGNGASLSVPLPAGAHTLRATVHDNNGHVVTEEINVNVLPAPGYCAAGGGWANPLYYITAVGLNGTTKQSGSHGGYTDFTAGTWMPATKGTNRILLVSAGGQPVYWTVWIDLNRDGSFTADEVLTKFRAPGTNTTVTIPDSAVTGLTRMRVSMLYPQWPQACGVGYMGETEDYTVIIR